MVPTTMVRRFGFGRWSVPDRLADRAVVEPVHRSAGLGSNRCMELEAARILELCKPLRGGRVIVLRSLGRISLGRRHTRSLTPGDWGRIRAGRNLAMCHRWDS